MFLKISKTLCYKHSSVTDPRSSETLCVLGKIDMNIKGIVYVDIHRHPSFMLILTALLLSLQKKNFYRKMLLRLESGIWFMFWTPVLHLEGLFLETVKSLECSA